MIAFASPIDDPKAYRRYAEPGIERAREPGSEVLALAAVGPAPRSYNLLLDAAMGLPELEALVIVHPRVEITDPRLCAKVRAALADPEVAIVGCAGATGVRSIAWWEGSVTAGPLKHSYTEHGGGEFAAFGWARRSGAEGEVETVDGRLLALAPWAVQNLRFDESLSLGHGYDLDYCLQARAASRKVVAADIAVTYHMPLELIEDLEVWTESHMRVADKWDLRANGTPWKTRARRAEAEREAARALVVSQGLELDARVRQLERMLEAATASTSWRLTAPLRWANRARRAAGRRIRDRRRSSGATR
jgi:hypothetical protein